MAWIGSGRAGAFILGTILLMGSAPLAGAHVALGDPHEYNGGVVGTDRIKIPWLALAQDWDDGGANPFTLFDGDAELCIITIVQHPGHDRSSFTWTSEISVRGVQLQTDQSLEIWDIKRFCGSYDMDAGHRSHQPGQNYSWVVYGSEVGAFGNEFPTLGFREHSECFPWEEHRITMIIQEISKEDEALQELVDQAIETAQASGVLPGVPEGVRLMEILITWVLKTRDADLGANVIDLPKSGGIARASSAEFEYIAQVIANPGRTPCHLAASTDTRNNQEDQAALLGVDEGHFLGRNTAHGVRSWDFLVSSAEDVAAMRGQDSEIPPEEVGEHQRAAIEAITSISQILVDMELEEAIENPSMDPSTLEKATSLVENGSAQAKVAVEETSPKAMREALINWREGWTQLVVAQHPEYQNITLAEAEPTDGTGGTTTSAHLEEQLAQAEKNFTALENRVAQLESQLAAVEDESKDANDSPDLGALSVLATVLGIAAVASRRRH